MLKFLLVVALFAAVVYTIAWTLERRRALGAGNALPKGLPKRRSAPPTKQVAPDDDEDFLRWLDRKRRKDGPAGPDGADRPDGTEPPDGTGSTGSAGSKDGTDGQGQEPAAD